MRHILRNVLVTMVFFGVLVFSSTSHSQNEATQALRVRRFVAPAYPALARTARIQGEADASIRINTDGTVASVELTAHSILRGYVEKALKQWQFDPLTAPAILNVVVNFELESCPGAVDVHETRVTADLPGNVHVGTCSDVITASSS